MPKTMVYTTLDPKNQEILLLTLHPGAFEEDIRCDLYSVSLNDDPSYLALSYCWGSDVKESQITINGHILKITKSLEAALRYRRDATRSITWWADAICINQNDNEEKQILVGMMRKVYVNASSVRVWLGESADDSDVAIGFLSSLKDIDDEHIAYTPDPRAHKAIWMLRQRPYWYRLWVVQEVLLAKTTRFRCGRGELGVEDFERFGLMTAKYRGRTAKKLTPLQTLFSYKGPTNPFDHMLDDFDIKRSEIAEGSMSLGRVLVMTGDSKCANPLDKVYGLLSMCGKSYRQGIPIDHTISSSELMVRAVKTRFVARAQHTPLEVLQTHQETKSMKLPTWIPDYTHPDHMAHLFVPDLVRDAIHYSEQEFPPGHRFVPYAAAANNTAW